jgi:hypothetical protein
VHRVVSSTAIHISELIYLDRAEKEARLKWLVYLPLSLLLLRFKRLILFFFLVTHLGCYEKIRLESELGFGPSKDMTDR